MKSKWSRRSVNLALHYVDEPASDPRRVHLWIFDLDSFPLARASRSWLSEAENQRSRRLKGHAAKRRSMASYSLTRLVLGKTLQVQPMELAFVEGTCGKPRVTASGTTPDRAQEVNFNVSHSENVMALALAYRMDVGVDVEVVDLAKGTRAFYLAWTAQEAEAKLLGVGIGSRDLPSPRRSDSKSLQLDFAGREVALTVAVSPSSRLPDPYQGVLPEQSSFLPRLPIDLHGY
jgi:phosphopantetheinyl transferase